MESISCMVPTFSKEVNSCTIENTPDNATKYDFFQTAMEEIQELDSEFRDLVSSYLEKLEKFLLETEELKYYSPAVRRHFYIKFEIYWVCAINALFVSLKHSISQVSTSSYVNLWNALNEIKFNTLSLFRSQCMATLMQFSHSFFVQCVFAGDAPLPTCLVAEYTGVKEAETNETPGKVLSSQRHTYPYNPAIRMFRELLAVIQSKSSMRSIYGKPELLLMRTIYRQHFDLFVSLVKDIFAFYGPQSQESGYPIFVRNIRNSIRTLCRFILLEVHRRDSSEKLMDILGGIHRDVDNIFNRKFPSMGQYVPQENTLI